MLLARFLLPGRVVMLLAARRWEATLSEGACDSLLLAALEAPSVLLGIVCGRVAVTCYWVGDVWSVLMDVSLLEAIR